MEQENVRTMPVQDFFVKEFIKVTTHHTSFHLDEAVARIIPLFCGMATSHMDEMEMLWIRQTASTRPHIISQDHSFSYRFWTEHFVRYDALKESHNDGGCAI